VRTRELRNAAAPGRRAPYAEAVALGLGAALLAAMLGAWAGGAWVLAPAFAVAAVAARHGVLPGLACATAGGLGAMAALWIAHGGLPATIALGLPEAALPAGLALTALAAGVPGERHRRRLRRALALYDRTHERHARLSQAFTAQSDELHVLELHVLAERETLPVLIQLFDQLGTLDPEAVPAHLCAIARVLLGGGEAAIYRLEAGHGHRVAAAGGSWPETISTPGTLWEAAGARDGALSLAGTAVHNVAHAPVQMAARMPHTGADSRLVLGLRDLPFTAFSRSRIAALEAALEVAAACLQRALSYRATRDRNVADALTGARVRAFFDRQLQDAYDLAARHAMPLAAVVIELARAPVAERQRQALGAAFAERLRPGDLLAEEPDRTRYLVLCPQTPTRAARELATDLAAALSRACPELAARAAAVPIDPRRMTPEDVRAHLAAPVVPLAPRLGPAFLKPEVSP